MDLEVLRNDTRTSLLDVSIVKADYEKEITNLNAFSFWSSKSKGLWEHQRAAICVAIAYVHGDKTLTGRSNLIEAALLKLPTATGKSGVIAVVSRCLSSVRRVLILTPRAALTKQLIDDVTFRFWGKVNYVPVDDETNTRLHASTGCDVDDASIIKLSPVNASTITREINDAAKSRIVLVGTHQALAEIRGDAQDDNIAKKTAAIDFLQSVKDHFDLVIVDEGHYEPAVSWSKGVRDFNLPTILLSATPYRNDFKSFRVGGRYLFNFPYQQAVAKKVVRQIEIQDLRPAALARRKKSAGLYDDFISGLKVTLASIDANTLKWFGTDKPKVIVRAGELSTLHGLQEALDRTFGPQSVLIHDKAVKDPTHPHRYTSVTEAERSFVGARFWLHQHMLSEGIDNPRFVVVAIYDIMGNARQLIQQMGRVARYLRPNTGNGIQCGYIVALPHIAQRIREAWQRYQVYERYVEANAKHIVINEVALPDRLLEYMPQAQYIDGSFRERFDFNGLLSSSHIQLPKTASVYRKDGAAVSAKILAETVEESLMEQDRFQIKPLVGMPPDAIGYSYYAWKNSPYLTEQFFSEWKLGIFVCIKKGDFVFMHDTGGLVLDMTALNLLRVERNVLEKVFPVDGGGEQSRLSRMSFTSLEMSQDAIRGLAMNTRSFSDTFTDLLDPSLVPSTAAGFVNGLPRYVGFARSRLRDGGQSYVTLDKYADWAEKVAIQLTDAARLPNKVFDRYAELVEHITEAEALPVSILIDLWTPQLQEGIGEGEDGYRLLEYFDRAELLADIDAGGAFMVTVDGQKILCQITYNGKTKRYRIESDGLEALLTLEPEGGTLIARPLLRHLNRHQSFRVLPKKPSVVYSEGNFYKPMIRWVTSDGGMPILDYIIDAVCLHPVDSEKGENDYSKPANWKSKSIFGIFSQSAGKPLKTGAPPSSDKLIAAIQSVPIWLCDDDSREVSDFIGLDIANKKIVFVHAKVGDLNATGSGFNVDALQIVGRQALASLAFISRGEPSPVWQDSRWTSDVQANKITLTGRDRRFGNPKKLSGAELNKLLISAIQSSSFNKEMWIVGAHMADKTKLEGELMAPALGNRLRQFLMHWDAMQTACARANVRLKFFCN